MATNQTFDGFVGTAGNPLTIGGYVYALRTTNGANTGRLSVQSELGDAVLELESSSGYLSIAQASGTAFTLNGLTVDRDISGLGSTYFVGFRNGVPVATSEVTNLLNIGDQRITFTGSQWSNLTEVRVYARGLLDVNLGTGFAIDDVTTTDSTAPLAPTLSAGVAATADNTPTLTGTAEAGTTVTILAGT